MTVPGRTAIERRRDGPERRAPPAGRSCPVVGAARRVGPRYRSRELAELGIDTVLDLVTHYPRRYIDGTRLVPIADLAAGDKASVLARVARVSRPPPGYGRGRRRGPSRVELRDRRRHRALRVVFFNQAWRAKQLPVGTVALFFGPVGTYRDALQLNSPTAEVLELAGEDGDDGTGTTRDGDATGTAEERSGAGSSRLPADREGQAHLGPHRPVSSARRSTGPGDFADPVPESRGGTGFGLIDRTAAFNHIHRPATMAEAEPARRRLAFDELFRLQLALVLRKARLQRDARGIRHVLARRGRRRRPWSSRFLDRPALRADRGPAPGHGGIGDDLAGPCPCTGCCRATWGRARRSWRWPPCWWPSRAATRGRSWPPPRCWPSSTPPEVRALLGGLHRPRPRRPSPGDRPLRVALLTNRTTAARAAPHPRRAGRRHGRPAHRHPRPAHRRRCAFRSSGWW